ncbi:metalloregulator ArsR/SmtB family transcription factor [Alkalilimnicola ehrlichii]|uniref:Transcriptional regulator n=1 Tax=Alkalilimnicola ehrlichii TaxID=351052 RepID=A0A3E0X249_9GAMM|nr:metalloregulator ArsR/SmtB family transcription factor [Alkalilimnicola ehrlichii]RFA38361.1 transcriptional regulator [Alkalilimnicola ehrlichii]
MHIHDPRTLFRALADSTRLRCLLLLWAEDQLCVCELVHALDMTQSRISRHLGHLRDLGIVKDERRGQWVFYRLHPQLPAWAREVLATTFAAESVSDIRQRLAGMPNRPLAECS